MINVCTGNLLDSVSSCRTGAVILFFLRLPGWPELPIDSQNITEINAVEPPAESACVWTSCRHNTHHVKCDGVVSARYLHCDGGLVVCYGTDVLPPVTHTGIKPSHPAASWINSKKKAKTYLWSMMDLPFLCLTNTPIKDTPMKMSLV